MIKNTTKISLFNTEYSVIVTICTPEKLRQLFDKFGYDKNIYSKEFLKNETTDRRGATFSQYLRLPIIWLDSGLDKVELMGTLAHEATHAVEFVFEQLGEDVKHSEIFAHSVAAIVRRAAKELNLL